MTNQKCEILECNNLGTCMIKLIGIGKIWICEKHFKDLNGHFVKCGILRDKTPKEIIHEGKKYRLVEDDNDN